MKKMFNRIKYSLLLLIITTIVACKEDSKEHKTAASLVAFDRFTDWELLVSEDEILKYSSEFFW